MAAAAVAAGNLAIDQLATLPLLPHPEPGPPYFVHPPASARLDLPPLVLRPWLKPPLLYVPPTSVPAPPLLLHYVRFASLPLRAMYVHLPPPSRLFPRACRLGCRAAIPCHSFTTTPRLPPRVCKQYGATGRGGAVTMGVPTARVAGTSRRRWRGSCCIPWQPPAPQSACTVTDSMARPQGDLLPVHAS